MKNKKKIVIIFSLLVIALIFFILFTQKKSDNTVCFESSCVDVELATTPKEMTIGLMNRTNLPENRGMLFIFGEEGIYKFWMKNTLIPLDMIWLDENGKIIYIEKSALPCDTLTCPVFGPESGSKYVLEVNGGYTETHKINVGDKARININGLFINELFLPFFYGYRTGLEQNEVGNENSLSVIPWIGKWFNCQPQ